MGRRSLVLLSITLMSLVGCGSGASAPAPRTPAGQQASCFAGNAWHSLDSCFALARESQEQGGWARYQTLAARLRVHQCAEDSSGCYSALEALWLHSDDPRDLAFAVERAQRMCRDGRPEACTLASAAAWIGHGVAVDPIGSVAWVAGCKGCKPWSPTSLETMAPHGWVVFSAEERVERIERFLADGDARSAELILSDAISRKLLTGQEAAVAGIEVKLAEGTWAKVVEPQWNVARPGRSIAIATPVVSRLPTGHSLRQRVERLRADTAARHLELARAAAAQQLTFAAALHFALARRFDAVDAAARIDLGGAFASLPLAPRFRLPVSCEWARRALEQRFPPAAANAEVVLDIVCTATERSWVTQEPYTYQEGQRKTVTRTVPGESREESYTCAQQGQSCATVAGVYRCIPQTQFNTCKRTVTGPSRTITEVVSEPVTRQGIRPVTHRELNVRISGAATMVGLAPKAISFSRTVSDDAYSVGGTKSFSAVSLSSLQAEAVTATAAAIELIRSDVRSAAAAEWLGKATSLSDPLAREDALLRAAYLGAAVPSIEAEYELGGPDIVALLRGQSFLALVAPAIVPTTEGIAGTNPRREMTAAVGGYTLEDYPPAPPTRRYRDDGGWKGTGLDSLLRAKRLSLSGGQHVVSTAGIEDETFYGGRLRLSKPTYIRREFGADWNYQLEALYDRPSGAGAGLRGGFSLGYRGRSSQWIFVAGLGYSSIGGIQTAGHNTDDASGLDVFYGGEFEFGLAPGLGLDGAVWEVAGGSLGGHRRYLVRLVQRRADRGSRAIELELREYDEDRKLALLGLSWLFGR